MVNYLVNRVLAVLHIVIRLVKRALCCFRRRRRVSCETVTLTEVGVIPKCEKSGSELQTWSSWEEAPTVVTASIDPVQQQIEMYRQQRQNLGKEEEEEPVDFFQDMTPRIMRQTKVLLQNKQTELDSDPSASAKFNYSVSTSPMYNSPELGVWEEQDQSWEAQAQQDWDVNDVLREKKRMEREKRQAEQQRKKTERDFRGSRSLTAARIS